MTRSLARVVVRSFARTLVLAVVGGLAAPNVNAEDKMALTLGQFIPFWLHVPAGAKTNAGGSSE
jgi:hypothetical protein